MPLWVALLVAVGVAFPSFAPAEEAAVAAAPAAVRAAILKSGCGACHTIPGVPGAAGRVGPDLSRIGVAAGSRKSGYTAEQYVRESILEPNAFIAPHCPSGACPSGVMLQTFAQTLSAPELEAIVRYLTFLGTRPNVARSPPAPVDLPRELPLESRASRFAAAPQAPGNPLEVSLGKALFFDTRLSGDRSLSCASCHDPGKDWTDGRELSRGYPETQYFRNTPTLLNSSLESRLYWDGRLSGEDLPTVVRDHLTEAHFMNMDGRLAAERLKQVPAYVRRFEEVYGGELRFGGILRSVAAYVATLISGPTPYDRFQAGDRQALGAEAARGLALFEGKAGCSRCHLGPLLSDERFHDVGVRSRPDLLDDPLRAITFRRFFRMLGVGDYRVRSSDPGLYALTQQSQDRHRFRTPGLREVSRTAPYMHDGSLATLADVVELFAAGGGPFNSARLQPLQLSAGEKSALTVFLSEALASPPLRVTPPIIPEYAVHPIASSQVPSSRVAAATPGIPSQARTPPRLGPLPPAPAPPDNPITPQKRELGRLLYFDRRLSGDGSLSCASCHPPGTGWGVSAPVSFGYPGTVHWRNASTILNTAYYNKLNWDGSAKSLELQNRGAWTGAVGGNLDPVMGEERLAQIPEYVRRFREVFGGVGPTFEDALRAVATYQRTLVSRNVPLDAYLRGEESAISDSAKRGYELFVGRAGCLACHNGPLASDQRFYALGVPLQSDFLTNPLRQITFRWETWAKGSDEHTYRTASEDLGLYFVTKQASDKGRFRTPSLRDLCYTAPYMHDGVFATLAQVVAFYDAGGGPHPNKDPRIRPLGLGASEQADLVALLEALCGDRITDEAPEMPSYARGIPDSALPEER